MPCSPGRKLHREWLASSQWLPPLLVAISPMRCLPNDDTVILLATDSGVSNECGNEILLKSLHDLVETYYTITPLPASLIRCKCMICEKAKLSFVAWMTTKGKRSYCEI